MAKVAVADITQSYFFLSTASLRWGCLLVKKTNKGEETIFHELYAHILKHIIGRAEKQEHDLYGRGTASEHEEPKKGSMAESIMNQLDRVKNTDRSDMMKNGIDSKKKNDKKDGGNDKNNKTDEVDKSTLKNIKKYK